MIPELPDVIAETLNDTSPGEDVASDAQVAAFIKEHTKATRPEILHGWIKALTGHIEDGHSRHSSAVSVVTGAMKETHAGYFTAQAALDALNPIFINAVALQPKPRTGKRANDEWDGIVAWAVGQALASDPAQTRARVDEKMPDNVEWVNNIGAQSDSQPDEEDTAADDDDETVRTVPWPTLSDVALQGKAGEIVRLVTPHTEADHAAILVQLLAEFGATVGSAPHFVAGNDRHQAIINPLIVGRTSNGAKGTGLAVVEVIRKRALPGFDACTVSGLSTAEGLIELVRDPSGDPDDEKNYDSGVTDKRLLVRECEYKSVLVRQRRDGNTLGPIMRDAFDCRDLRTLTRKNNKLTATRPHIVIIGHVTPGEFRATLEDADLSGGSINRLLICLSRRSRLRPRLGNLPDDVLAEAAAVFKTAHDTAQDVGELEFTDEFWTIWEAAYRELNRDRPDTKATDATARAVTQVLRLSLLYALFDSEEEIGVEHLDAALALWSYAEHSARWLFSNHELERQRESVGGLAAFIRDGGRDGRTRTEISADYFKRNIKAAEITSELTPLVHDGVIIEVKDETGARPITRYIHRDQRINEFTKNAGQDAAHDSYGRNSTNSDASPVGSSVRKFVDERTPETPSDLHNSSNSLIRKSEEKTEPPGNGAVGVDRALAIAARLNAAHASKPADGVDDETGVAS